jgi:hypothetical protein
MTFKKRDCQIVYKFRNKKNFLISILDVGGKTVKSKKNPVKAFLNNLLANLSKGYQQGNIFCRDREQKTLKLLESLDLRSAQPLQLQLKDRFCHL